MARLIELQATSSQVLGIAVPESVLPVAPQTAAAAPFSSADSRSQGSDVGGSSSTTTSASASVGHGGGGVSPPREAALGPEIANPLLERSCASSPSDDGNSISSEGSVDGL